MQDWAIPLAETLSKTVFDVLPIAVILFTFQVLVLKRRIPNLRRVLAGVAYVIVGLALFVLGLERALFPLGETMAQQLAVQATDAAIQAQAEAVEVVGPQHFAWVHFAWVYVFAAAIGFSTTIAEPTLIAVAHKASEASGGSVRPLGLRIAVAVGVALGVALGTFRIVTGAPLYIFIMAGYAAVIVQTAFAQRAIIPLAYDSGGVTTSTVTVPLVTALGLGLAATVPGRSPLVEGFGLIAFASLFPIMTVMGYAQLGAWWTGRSGRGGGKEE
jgi:hypothetical protein